MTGIPPVFMKRPAFAIIEMLIVIGVMGAIATLSIPLYREYQIRSDLDNAVQQTTQGLARARLLSQLGEGDSMWGFYVPAGVLYKGEAYETRDQEFDETYPMPSTIAVTGLLEVAYSKVKGVPNATGNIVLRALNNDERVIQVTIAVDIATVPANPGDVFTVCFGGQSIQIPDATWPTYQGQGATMGSCLGSSSSAAAQSSSASSAASSAQGSSASGSSAAGGGGGSTACSSKFTLAANGTVTTTASTSVTFTNMLSQITFGAGGPAVSVHACQSQDGGSTFGSLYGTSSNCNGNGNAYGNAVRPGGTDVKTMTIASGRQMVLKIAGKYRQNGWLAFNESFLSNDQTGHIQILVNGTQLSNYPGFGSQTSLKNYLISQGKANSEGVITTDDCELVYITELGDLGTSASDFQDDVMSVTFQ